MAQGLGRTDERESPLLLVAQYLDRDAGRIGDRLRDVVAVAGLAHGRGGDGADLPGTELFGEPDLGRDDVADFVDLLGPDCAIAVERLVDPSVGALLHHLLD